MVLEKLEEFHQESMGVQDEGVRKKLIKKIGEVIENTKKEIQRIRHRRSVVSNGLVFEYRTFYDYFLQYIKQRFNNHGNLKWQ